MRGSRVCVCGNLDPVAVLMSGTVQEVEAATRACIAAADEKMMLAAGCEVPANTPLENLMAMDRLLFC